jgi:hypothetical protein
MNKELIRRTAVCWWSSGDQCYVVESPLLPICAGADDDPARAWVIFDEMLQDIYTAYLEGTGIGYMFKLGRPPKGNVPLNCAIKPDTKELIETVAAELGSSQGEVVDYLMAFYKAVTSFPSIVTTHPPINVTAPPPRPSHAAPHTKSAAVREPKPAKYKTSTKKATKEKPRTTKRK